MSAEQFLGMLVIALVTLAGLFSAVYKPLNKNTEAMTTLALKLSYLSDQLDEQKNEFKEHKGEFEKYKDKVRESQKRQWDEIDRHSDKLKEHEHMIEQIRKEKEE